MKEEKKTNLFVSLTIASIFWYPFILFSAYMISFFNGETTSDIIYSGISSIPIVAIIGIVSGYSALKRGKKALGIVGIVINSILLLIFLFLEGISLLAEWFTD